MKTLFTILAALAFQFSQANWISDGTFSIYMPCDDVEYVLMEEDPTLGLPRYEYWYGMSWLGDLYSLAFSELESYELDGITAEEFLRTELSYYILDVGITNLEEQRIIYVHGYPCILARGTTEESYMTIQLILVGNRLYELYIDSWLSYVLEEDEKEFFGSFQLNVRIAPNAPSPLGSEVSGASEKEYEYADFTIDFEAEPEVASTKAGGYFGIPVTTYTVQGDFTIHQVAVGEISPEQREGYSDREVLQNEKEDISQSMGITTTEYAVETIFKSNHGIMMKGNTGAYYVNYLLVIVGEQLYKISVLQIGSYPPQPEVEAFFDSFTLK